MNERLFRKAALDRLASPDQLDRLPRLAPPGNWLGVAGVAILGAAALWLFFWSGSSFG